MVMTSAMTFPAHIIERKPRGERRQQKKKQLINTMDRLFKHANRRNTGEKMICFCFWRSCAFCTKAKSVLPWIMWFSYRSAHCLLPWTWVACTSFANIRKINSEIVRRQLLVSLHPRAWARAEYLVCSLREKQTFVMYDQFVVLIQLTCVNFSPAVWMIVMMARYNYYFIFWCTADYCNFVALTCCRELKLLGKCNITILMAGGKRQT